MYVSSPARCLSLIDNFNPTSKGILKLKQWWIRSLISKTTADTLTSSGNLGYQSVLSQPGGSYSILFLVFKGSMGLGGFRLHLGGGGGLW